MLKVVIGIPFSGRFVPPEWAISLTALQFPMSTNYAYFTVKGRPRAEARTRLVEAAKGAGAEYILFLDDDTAPPSDTIIKLLKTMDSDPEIAVCGGIYTNKTRSVHEPMVFMHEGMGPFWRWRFGEVFPCWGLGTGCMMIRCSVFDDLPKPWFADVETKEDAEKINTDLIQDKGTPFEPKAFIMTDDIFFCKKLGLYGKKVVAHGGVLPVHFDQEGKGHVLDVDSFPVKGLTDMWYNSLVPAEKLVEHGGDGLPDGWLTEEEAMYLAKRSVDKKVLELGAYKGRSTVIFSVNATKVVSVDRHTGDEDTRVADTLPEYLRNIDGMENVIPIIGDFRNIEDIVADDFDVVFVDGYHAREAARKDFEFAKRVGKEILAHDWGLFEVSEAAADAGLTPAEIVGTVARLVPIQENS